MSRLTAAELAAIEARLLPTSTTPTPVADEVLIRDAQRLLDDLRAAQKVVEAFETAWRESLGEVNDAVDVLRAIGNTVQADYLERLCRAMDALAPRLADASGKGTGE